MSAIRRFESYIRNFNKRWKSFQSKNIEDELLPHLLETINQFEEMTLKKQMEVTERISVLKREELEQTCLH